MLITTTDDSQLCNISLNPTLYLITTTEHAVTNQSKNETNKYADKNRLRGYRFLLVGVCRQVKLTAAHRGHAAILKVAAIFDNFCCNFKSCCNF